MTYFLFRTVDDVKRALGFLDRDLLLLD
eukprot:SAG11_NODE_28200_length_324_cov_0.920000_2_plen_27_part_01